MPHFLLKQEQKVLNTGKYLNVIREMGRDIKYTQQAYEQMQMAKAPEEKKNDEEDEPMNEKDVEIRDEGQIVEYDSDQQMGFHTIYEHIDKAYHWSSQMLLEVIFNECRLLSRLDSIKHFFFLDRGDFFSVLVNGSEELFEKAREQVSKEKLDSYLQMAVKQSSLRSEPF